MDAYAGVSRGIEQWTVRASRELGADGDTTVGRPDPLRGARAAARRSASRSTPTTRSRSRSSGSSSGAVPAVPRAPRGAPRRATATASTPTSCATTRSAPRAAGSRSTASAPSSTTTTWVSTRDHSWGVRYQVGAPVADVAPAPVAAACRRLVIWSPMLCERARRLALRPAHLLTSGTRSATGSASSSRAASSTPTAARSHFAALVPELEVDPAQPAARRRRAPLHDGRRRSTRDLDVDAVSDTGFHLGAGLYFGFDGHWHGEWRGGELVVDGEHVADCTDPRRARPPPPAPRLRRAGRRPGRRRRRVRQPAEPRRRPAPRPRPRRGRLVHVTVRHVPVVYRSSLDRSTRRCRAARGASGSAAPRRAISRRDPSGVRSDTRSPRCAPARARRTSAGRRPGARRGPGTPRRTARAAGTSPPRCRSRSQRSARAARGTTLRSTSPGPYEAISQSRTAATPKASSNTALTISASPHSSDGGGASGTFAAHQSRPSAYSGGISAPSAAHFEVLAPPLDDVGQQRAATRQRAERERIASRADGSGPAPRAGCRRGRALCVRRVVEPSDRGVGGTRAEHAALDAGHRQERRADPALVLHQGGRGHRDVGGGECVLRASQPFEAVVGEQRTVLRRDADHH